jgi:anti-sigma B factor antagonist
MFEIEYRKDVHIVRILGNFDASKTQAVKDILGKINETFSIDMSELNFICSAGIGVLVMTYKRLKESGEKIYLTNLNDHIKKVFEASRLDTVFDIK